MSDNSYEKEVSEKFITVLKWRSAPWQRSCEPDDLDCFYLPFNPLTGKPYRGINAFLLLSQERIAGHGDPRWLTEKQARQLDATILPKSEGTRIEYWKSVKEGENARPQRFTAVVFNAQQIDGLPPFQPSRLPTMDERYKRAETIVLN